MFSKKPVVAPAGENQNKLGEYQIESHKTPEEAAEQNKEAEWDDLRKKREQRRRESDMEEREGFGGTRGEEYGGLASASRRRKRRGEWEARVLSSRRRMAKSAETGQSSH